jgi:long-chain acyl-CoA synthetase
VIGVPDAQWGEAVKAVCVLASGQAVTAEELIDFVAARIARFKKPKFVALVSELPKTADGRIDRVKVKELYGAAG